MLGTTRQPPLCDPRFCQRQRITETVQVRGPVSTVQRKPMLEIQIVVGQVTHDHPRCGKQSNGASVVVMPIDIWRPSSIGHPHEYRRLGRMLAESGEDSRYVSFRCLPTGAALSGSLEESGGNDKSLSVRNVNDRGQWSRECGCKTR